MIHTDENTRPRLVSAPPNFGGQRITYVGVGVCGVARTSGEKKGDSHPLRQMLYNSRVSVLKMKNTAY